MNPTVSVHYEGELRTKARHILSNQFLAVNAPPDASGDEEAFSPTDLLATSLLTSMITVIGMLAQQKDLQLGEVEGEIEKIMLSNPKRISALMIELSFHHHQLNEMEKSRIEEAAINCPVARSIHPDIAVNIKFSYN